MVDTEAKSIILMVDDSHDSVMSFDLLLGELHDRRIVSTTIPEEALEILAEITDINGRAIVFLDYHLGAGKMSGLDLLLKIKEMGKPNIVVYFLTGYPRESLHIKVIEGGARGLIHKPITVDLLHAYIKNAEDQMDTIRKSMLVDQDFLTAAYSRVGLTNLGMHEIQRAHRSKHGIGALFIDMNEFKSINDKFGHAAGDEVLKVVAQILKEERSSDIVARISGDEFVVLLIDANSRKDVESAVERIGHKLCSVKVDCADGLLIEASAAVGGAYMPLSRFSSDPRKTLDALIRLSDQAMYSRKKVPTSR